MSNNIALCDEKTEIIQIIIQSYDQYINEKQHYLSELLTQKTPFFLTQSYRMTSEDSKYSAHIVWTMDHIYCNLIFNIL